MFVLQPRSEPRLNFMFTWDESIRKYRDDEGNIIEETQLRKWIDEMLKALAFLLIARAETLRKDFTVENFQMWNQTTRKDINALHYAMTIIAFGGSSEMDSERWNIAEAVILTQISYFDAFARDVLAGSVPMNGRFPVRTSLYAFAGYSTFIQAETIRETFAGRTEERRFTTSGAPCDDCKAERKKGWQPIGTLRAIGDSECLVRCRCFKKYR